MEDIQQGKRTKAPSFFLILILGLLSAIGPFSIDMYLPAFPSIAADLGTTVGRVTLSLSSFFIGISAGQFLYGPLLDRFGRKKPLYVGLSVYVLASAACIFARSVDMLIALRLLQALGTCAGMVASRAMVRDLFAVSESAKVFSLLILVIGVSPIIAPTLGGIIASSLSWRYIFVVLTGIAVVVLAAVHFGLPESRKPDPGLSLKPRPILLNFIQVMREPQFYTYALAGAIASAGLYAYIAGSPYVFMELFRVTERQYGWIFAIIAVGLIGSSQLNSVLLRTYSSEQLVRVALIIQSVLALVLFIGSLTGKLELYSTISLIFFFLCCQGFIFPNSSALALAPFSRMAGTASALMGGIQMSLGALTTALVGFLANRTSGPMTGVMMGCALTALSILLMGRRVIRYRAREADRKEETAEMINLS